jgi:hypothetical protein
MIKQFINLSYIGDKYIDAENLILKVKVYPDTKLEITVDPSEYTITYERTVNPTIFNCNISIPNTVIDFISELHLVEVVNPSTHRKIWSWENIELSYIREQQIGKEKQ